jgi:hypothetical protein
MPKQTKRPRSGQVAHYRAYGHELGKLLTPNELNFAEAFIGPAQGDVFKAAHMAGYSTAQTGTQVIRRPQVRDYIDMRLQEYVELGAALSPLEIQRIWRNLANNPDPLVALRATENAAKTLGMFAPREQVITVNQNSNPAQQLANLDTLFDQLPSDVLDVLIFLLQRKKDNKQLTAEVLAEVVEQAQAMVDNNG